MRSMTGYGRSTINSTEENFQIEVEIASVNRKSLDVYVSCPREWNGLDQECRRWLKDTFQRGRMNIQIKYESAQSSQPGFTLNPEIMDATIEQLSDYANSRNLPFEVNSQLLLNLAKTFKDSTGIPEWQTLTDTIQPVFSKALNELNNMRAKEGEALAKDLNLRIQNLDSMREQIAVHSKNSVKSYQTALLNRLNQLEVELDLNDERVLREVALFADRCDISEELTRLESHFEQFKEFIQTNAPIGRKMDFLCQEINREFNTIGSKVTAIESTRIVIEAKNELERIREQVQNIE